MIFFKVGKFYELYEEDAAVAYEVLGYKVTVSGVGRCRYAHVPAVSCLAPTLQHMCSGEQATQQCSPEICRLPLTGV